MSLRSPHACGGRAVEGRELLHLLFLVFASILAASPAGASWFETGFVRIVANLSPAEAEDIVPGDVIESVQIGSAGASGELTVVGEGDVTTRQSLGSWEVSNGQGNIQSTFGEGSFEAASGNYPSPTEGVLDILASDIVGNVFAGEGGTLRLTASRVDNIRVVEGGSAYLSMGSRAKILTTRRWLFRSAGN